MATTQGLASIGVKVEVNSVKMNYVTDIGDIGGAPNMLDATCLDNRMTHNVMGVQDAPAFTVTYLYDDTDAESDFVVLKALEKAGTIVPIVVTTSSGGKHESEGTVSTYVNGVGVNALMQATLSVALAKDWEFTKAT